MELQKNNTTLTKQNAFISSLQNDSLATIAKFGQCLPTVIEEIIDLHHKKIDSLDTLNRSKKFFETQYQGKDKNNLLVMIKDEISKINHELTLIPKPETLGELKRSHPTALQKSLQLLINDLRLFFQVDNMLSTESIISLCPLLIYDFANLTLEEITICFSQAKRGHYGELYNRLDGPIILKWLRQYHTEKLERLKERNYVREVHAKIDVAEGRKDFKGTHAQLMENAYCMMMIEKTRTTNSQPVP
jgi:hypothetical protein